MEALNAVNKSKKIALPIFRYDLDNVCATRSFSKYYSRPNQFERFRVFLELISRFEFDFLRREFFFERFEFLVCSCECAVACLCPRNSISNVVVSVTIHDDMFIYK